MRDRLAGVHNPSFFREKPPRLSSSSQVVSTSLGTTFYLMHRGRNRDVFAYRRGTAGLGSLSMMLLKIFCTERSKISLSYCIRIISTRDKLFYTHSITVLAFTRVSPEGPAANTNLTAKMPFDVKCIFPS